MNTRNTFWIIIIFTTIFLLAGYFLSPFMGVRMATHWNAQGEADGYGSLFSGLYLLPLVNLFFSFLILFSPALDPMKSNISKFRNDFNLFVIAFSVFLNYMHGLTLAWNLGLNFSMNAAIAPAFGLLFILTGRMVLKARRNYLIGIRTPWTLANDQVWENTHQIGGKLFIASGVLTSACLLFPDATYPVLFFTAIGSSIIAFVYSYLEYRRIDRQTTSR